MKTSFLLAMLTVLFFSCKKENNSSNCEILPASLSEMIAENGQNPEAASPYYVPTSLGKTKEQHAYLGLTGFDKNELSK
jgi:hypothetical protein